jgi:hypothetical protein
MDLLIYYFIGLFFSFGFFIDKVSNERYWEKAKDSPDETTKMLANLAPRTSTLDNLNWITLVKYFLLYPAGIGFLGFLLKSCFHGE